MVQNWYRKTDKGREEISTRKYGLSLRLRSILLLIDGKRSGSDLVTTYPGLGLTDALLHELEREGYIARVKKTPESPKHSSPNAHASDHRGRGRSRTKKAAKEKILATETSLILDTIFPADMPLPREMLCEGSAMTREDDHWQRRSAKTLPDEFPTLFDAIKTCYLNGLRDLSPAAVAPFLRSLGSARTTRALAELRPAYLRTLATAKGKAAAIRQDEELELLLFACAA